MCRTKNFALLT